MKSPQLLIAAFRSWRKLAISWQWEGS